MQTYQQTYLSFRPERLAYSSIFNRFINWCGSQEESRFGWTAFSIALHACVLTPLTLLAVVTNGNSTFLFCVAMYAMTMSLVTNLAALPTKVTIPVFFASVVMNLSVLGWCIHLAWIS